MGSTTRFAFGLTTAFATVFLLSAGNARAQDPQGQEQAQGSQSQPSQPPEVQPAPVPPDQQDGADSRPVTSRDTFPQDQQPQATPAPRRYSRDRPPSAGSAGASAPVPANLIIPPGTVIFARLAEPLSSDQNQAGDTFTATLDRPIVVDGWVVARRGETIIGSVPRRKKPAASKAFRSSDSN